MTTTYSYQGNLVTATDPAGKQKTFTMDAFGNLTQVQEPNPQGGSAYVTTYTYDLLNNLTQVSMPRPTGTQTRTFVYNGPYLMSATNPENGTVSYTYNSIYKVATKTDAKGQQVQYDYDTLGRLTQVHRFVPQNGQLVENTCAEELYSYDTNPYDSSYSGYYTAGRLTAVQYYFCAPYPVYGANTTFTDMYNYSQAGGKTGKRLQVTRPAGSGNSTVNLDGSYTYDNEGRMTAEQYPSWDGAAGPNLGYAYDTMGRLNTLTDLTAQSSIISGTTYGASNELLTMSGLVNETRTYNSMLQLLSLVASASAGPSVNLSYAYSSTQNNGKITSQTDNLSGEQVVYTYDALNRLASAAATSNSWGQSFSYDGFGNLTGQTVTAGSAPSYSVTPDPSTNHLGGEDANGNAPYSNDANGTNYVMAYDVENRYTGSLTSTGSFAYGYAPGNKRVYRGVANGSTLATDEVTYWSATGQKLATYQMVLNGSQYIAVQTETYYWFGGKLIRNATGYVTADRLGSIGHFYPYGLEKPSATTNGTEKFTGYLRDAETGLDYADQRYHDPGTGRFMTADPFGPSAHLDNPTTWNRYAYTDGDPVNNFDPTGLDDEDCRKTLSVINRRVYGNTSDKLQPAKGLVQRYNEQIYGNYGPGSTQWALHNTIIQQVQGGVKQLMKKYIDDKCPPPSNWKHTDEWVNRPLPTNREYKGPTTMFFDPLPIIIDDILEYLPLIADAGTTSVDDTVSYDMSPYGGAGEVADTGGDDQTASVDSTIWYDMSPYMGAGGGGVYSSFDPVEN